MANAYVEYGSVALKSPNASSVHGECVYTDVLAISGSTDTTDAALTPAQYQNRDMVARVSTDDTACFVAVGSTPDPTALVKTNVSSARRYLAAGATISVQIGLGDKVAVKAVS